MCKSIPLISLRHRQQLFVDVAKGLCHRSGMQHKHGAVLVYKGKVIAEGYNYYTDCKNYWYTIHAEVSVIKKFLKTDIELNAKGIALVAETSQ